MRDTDVYLSPSRVPATIALLLGGLGLTGMWWSFAPAVPAALDGGGSSPYPVVFVVATSLALAGLGSSIVCLVRGLARGIAGLAFVVALAPLVVATVRLLVHA